MKITDYGSLGYHYVCRFSRFGTVLTEYDVPLHHIRYSTFHAPCNACHSTVRRNPFHVTPYLCYLIRTVLSTTSTSVDVSCCSTFLGVQCGPALVPAKNPKLAEWVTFAAAVRNVLAFARGMSYTSTTSFALPFRASCGGTPLQYFVPLGRPALPHLTFPRRCPYNAKVAAFRGLREDAMHPSAYAMAPAYSLMP